MFLSRDVAHHVIEMREHGHRGGQVLRLVYKLATSGHMPLTAIVVQLGHTSNFSKCQPEGLGNREPIAMGYILRPNRSNFHPAVSDHEINLINFLQDPRL